MDTPRLTRLLAATTVALLALIALLWWWPRGTTAPDADLTVATRPAPGAPPAAAAATGGGPSSLVEGPTAAELPGATKYCTTIVDWHRRNVPAWVIEDNMMAQGMKFDEQDLACLTAGGVPPQVLDFAEQNTRRPQPKRPN